jgi:endonuclease
MRLVIATCTVDYAGRLSAHLPSATRLLMVKADGSVSVHSDGNAYKPLNWMTQPCVLKTEPGRWVVTNTKGESLTITIDEIHLDVGRPLGPDPGLQKDGVEAQLQELLAANPEFLLKGLQLVRREYPTDIGPVDLLCRDADGRPMAVEIDGGAPEDGSMPHRGGRYVAVEIKRRAGIDAVEQLARYLERLDLDGRLAPVKGILAAQVIAPQARVLAASRGIQCIEVDYDLLQGSAVSDLTLF